MKTKITLSKEELEEKQRLILDLSDKLLEALKSSEMFKQGMTNKHIALDVLMGIGFFTASILDAADECAGANDAFSEFYTEEILPTAYKMYKELNEMKETQDPNKMVS